MSIRVYEIQSTRDLFHILFIHVMAITFSQMFKNLCSLGTHALQSIHWISHTTLQSSHTTQCTKQHAVHSVSRDSSEIVEITMI